MHMYMYKSLLCFIVFSGEVDAIDEQAKESCKYVEFKTTRQLDNYRQERNFIK